jgi:hypothetical protein
MGAVPLPMQPRRADRQRIRDSDQVSGCAPGGGAFALNKGCLAAAHFF